MTTNIKYHYKTLKTQSIQREGETFIAFCNRVLLEANHCSFKCASVNCTAEDTIIRDQIIIDTVDNDIRQEALKRSWDLETSR